MSMRAYQIMVSCFVLALFFGSAFLFYLDAKRYIKKAKAQQEQINRLLEEKEKMQETIDLLMRRIINQHETIVMLSGEKPQTDSVDKE